MAGSEAIPVHAFSFLRNCILTFCETLGHTICLAKVIVAHFSCDCEARPGRMSGGGPFFIRRGVTQATYLAKVFLAHFSLVWEAWAGRLYIWPLLMKRRTPCGVPKLAKQRTVEQNICLTLSY